MHSLRIEWGGNSNPSVPETVEKTNSDNAPSSGAIRRFCVFRYSQRPPNLYKQEHQS